MELDINMVYKAMKYKGHNIHAMKDRNGYLIAVYKVVECWWRRYRKQTKMLLEQMTTIQDWYNLISKKLSKSPIIIVMMKPVLKKYVDFCG